ncbi:MAG: cell division protein FtsQ/DivIB [Saprospiraceae bacterium]
MLSDLLTMRVPQLRYGKISWVVFILITILILLSAVTRKKNSFASSTSVEIDPLESGEKMLGEHDVRQNLLQAFGNTLEGTELADLEVERIERVLEGDPFVEDAEVYVGQSNALHIYIRQREPILRVLDNNGGNYYLDNFGSKIPTSSLYAPRVLVATGNIAPYTADFQEKRRNTLKDLFTLTTIILNDPVWSHFIQQVHVNNANEFILVPLIGDQKIVLGSIKNIEDKLKRLKTFYQEGMPYAGWRAYSSVSLKYNGQVVCRK